MDYEIWAVTQRHVYQRQIHSVDELKRRLIDVWCSLEQSIFTRLLTSCEDDFECLPMLYVTLSTAGELTMLILSTSVTFSVTCLTVAFLILLQNHASNVGQYILVHFTR